MNKLSNSMVILFPLLMVLRLQAMEAPIKKANDSDNTEKLNVIIFGKGLWHVEVAELLLACSQRLRDELVTRKRNATKPDPYYNYRVISTDLSYKKLSKLKNLIELAHEINKNHVSLTKSEIKLVKKFQISPFYESLSEEEIQDTVDDEIKKPSLHQRMIQFLHTSVDERPYNLLPDLKNQKGYFLHLLYVLYLPMA